VKNTLQDWNASAAHVPSAQPTREPASATTAPWMRKIVSTERREAPIARRMPISRDFCTTETTSTDEIPKATAMATKNWIIAEEPLCPRRPTSNSALVFIQLSAVRPVRAAMVFATASALKRSSTVRSMFVTPPARSSRVCADRSVMMTHRRFRSRSPRSKIPATVTTCVRPPAATRRILSPTEAPRSFARSTPTTASSPAT